MRRALERHDDCLRSSIDEHSGYVFATGGDGFAVAFDRAGDALAAATTAQEKLGEESWPEGVAIRVRMGLHTGEAAERDGDYFGTTVNRAARLMATAHGGQIVCSRSTADLVDGMVGLHGLGEHRLRDLSAAVQVFQVGDGTFPPLRSVDAVPTNLPTARTELIGRSEEVKVLAALAGRERLVTLTGVGGVGKTRLALGVGAAIAPDYADGCWLVDLAPVSDGSEVPVATASAIRAPVTDSDALVKYLSDRRMVIVLDNCEHIISDVADLVDALLEATTDVHVIATSREPLGLDGEIVRRVSSLVIAKGDATPEEALDTPAVRLFVERASAVVDQFTLEDTTVASVVEICRRLDGIPLAIELAAARMRSMPADEISRRLDERFRLLSGGSRRAQERHRTLAATVSWSHDLLLKEDQTVFRRLAVFPASFGLDAAEAVAAGDEMLEDVVDCMLRLVDRSLVQYDPDLGRYRLLETLRQYAADRLAETGETEATRERHARHFLALAERIGPDLLDAHFYSAIATLVAELDNLRAAATWCVDLNNWVELTALCRQTFLLAHQEAPVDGADWRRQVVEHESDVPIEEVVAVLGEHAFLEGQSLGDFAESFRLAEASRVLADRAGLQRSAWEGVACASVFVMTGRFADVLPAAERATEIAESAESFGPQVTALLMRSSALSSLDRSEESAAVAAEALRRAEISGSPLNISAAVTTVAANYLNLRSGPDFEASKRVIDSRPDVFKVTGTSEMWLSLMRGWTLIGLGEPNAVGHVSRAFRLADRLNAPHVSESALRLLALAFVQSDHVDEAACLLTYVEDRLAPFRIGSPGQLWVQSQLDRARIGAASSARVSLSRGELLSLVATVERSIKRDL